MAAEIRWLGLAENKVQETTKNAALTNLLQRIVELARKEGENGEVIDNKQKVELVPFISLHNLVI